METINFQQWLLTAEKPESFSSACSFAEFLLKYIKPSQLDILYVDDDLDSLVGAPKKRLESCSMVFGKAGVEVEQSFVHGHFAKGTSSFSETNHNDIIICGAEPVTGFRRFWNGSETYKLIRSAKSSVISLQKEYTKDKLQTIVVPIDASKETTEKVKMASALSKLFQSKILLLGLDSGKGNEFKQLLQANVKKASEKLNAAGVAYESYTLSGSNLTDITLQFCEDHQADMVMMMAVEEANPKGMFEGSFPEQMILKSQIPVFALRPEIELS